MKKKRLRKWLIVLLALAAVVTVIVRLNIEPADYRKTLSKQVTKAEKLLDSVKIGNAEGMYAEFTAEDFQKQIEEAESVSKDKDSYYELQKKAYETLKKETENFKKSVNTDCLSADEVKELMESSKVKIETVKFSEYEELEWYIDGQEFTKAEPINLEVKLKGPNYDSINSYLEKNELQGQVFALYHNGEFPGKIGLNISISSEGKSKAYLYRYDAKEETLNFCSEAVISQEKAQITVTEGGDYLILLNKLGEDGSAQTVQEEETEPGTTDASQGTVSETKGISIAPAQGDEDGNEDAQTVQDEYTYHCTLEIRCDTLAADLSKLTNASLAKYVPANGTILAKTQFGFNNGETVYDVLYRNCRNKNIQMSARYTPMYGSQYVEGINYLYEFDGGQQSGWMYKVNGWFPNYGCSKYKLKDGDVIVWAYTCEGLGKDLGASTDWQ